MATAYTNAQTRRGLGARKRPNDVLPSLGPRDAQRQLERARERRNVMSGKTSLREILKTRKPKYETSKGLRRLSFAEAYARRTTPESKQRAIELYGRSAPPSARALGQRQIARPVSDQQRARVPMRRRNLWGPRP